MEKIAEQNRHGQNEIASLLSAIPFYFAHLLRSPRLVTATALLTVAATGCDLSVPWLVAKLLNLTMTGMRDTQTSVRNAWLLLVGVYFGAILLRFISSWVMATLQTKNMSSVVYDGFCAALAMPSSWYDRTSSAAVVRNISRGMWGVSAVGSAIFGYGLAAFLVLIGFVITIGLRWPVAGLLTLALIVIFVAVYIVVALTYLAPASRRTMALDTELNAELADVLSNSAVVNAFTAGVNEAERAQAYLDRYRIVSRQGLERLGMSTGLQSFLQGILFAGLSGLFLWNWQRGLATVGDVGFGITVSILAGAYLQNLITGLRQLYTGINDVRPLVSLTDAAKEAQDSLGSPPALVASDVKGPSIVFEDVCFTYNRDTPPLFDKVSLFVRPGEHVGIVGPTGAGKTTIIRLLLRLYELNGGRIMIDGVDISSVSPESLRKYIAIVPQEPTLFHRSVAENIGFGRPDASLDEIERAARAAQAHEFILRLPCGYETIIGERGHKLSGGERQRIAIARAILANRPLLILDEATSSLDTETEALVKAATRAVVQGRTTISIAHRLSTIEQADRLLVLDQGNVVESGTHDELLKSGVVYPRLILAGAVASLA